MPKKPKSLLEILDRVPPCVCRMAAVEQKAAYQHVQRISVNELAKRSGIGKRNFLRISHMTTWKDVKVGVAMAFSEACGINLLDENPLYYFLLKRHREGLPYFKKAQREMFDKVIAKLDANAKHK